MVSGKEYLATAFNAHGCLYLWDVESKTPKKVFNPHLSKKKRFKEMIIFKIDDNTIGFGEVFASHDGSRKVFILKMDTEEMTLSSTLWLFTPNNICDICYTEVDSGTPCLMLCIPREPRIMAVEMGDSKTRWVMGRQQIGKNFEPWGICTDQKDIAYVADFGQDMIHLLSASDGTVLKQFETGNYGINNVFCVRFHDEHL